MNRFGPRACRALFAAVGLLASVSAFVSAALAQPAQTSAQTSAQAWPQRPVRFILPFGAGTATDVAARLMSEKLSVRWGRPIVIENRPGADGLLAINAFISANDDHVLLYASTASFMAHPYTLEKMPYSLDPIRSRRCPTVSIATSRRSRGSPTPFSPRACRRR
jgi:tripartite-type tricarboxylate transporter receptor subunit TctC